MISTKYKTIVIEDEEGIRKDLVDELINSDEFEVIGEANSISSAYKLITSKQADVIFLDIRIIEGSALHLIKELKDHGIYIPPVVITTAFRDFNDAEIMLNELNDEVIMLLNKPFWKNWAISKIKILTHLERKNRSQSKQITTVEDEHPILIQDQRQMIHILPSEIISVKTGEKRQGRTVLVLTNTSMDCNLTMAQLLEKLPDYFMQISRYEAINIKKVSVYKQSDRELIMKNGYNTFVGPKYHLTFLNEFIH